ncbi:hypothetical protein IH992_23845 [Candidatus Poribacteria bacterium]|nr:hypothetical protein [Candidatus Poribacteria bacterium]
MKRPKPSQNGSENKGNGENGDGDGDKSDGGDNDFTKHGGDPRMTVAMDTGSLGYWPGGDGFVIPIGWLDVTAKDDTIREAIDAVIEAAGIHRVH